METELLNERFDVPEPDIWHAISLYSTEFLLGNPPGPWGYSDHEIVDPRNCREWHGDYDGIPLAISFPRDKDKLIWFGVTQINSGQWGRCEHLLGFLEVRRVMITSDIPVEVRIVCCWKPFYLFFSEMADALITRFHRQPVHLARSEVLNFKSLVERQTYKDILVDGKPQEAIARSNLQHFLVGRSYRETPVRGGRADLLVFSSQGRFLYETKIWRGKTYFDQGLREIEEYIRGEDDDHQLTAVFYIVFDHTKSAAARTHCGSDLSTLTVADRTVDVIIVSLAPPKPSKKECAPYTNGALGA